MFRFLKRNDSEVITPEVVDVPVMTIQSNIAMALALCMEEYLRSVSKTSVDIPNRVCGEKNQRTKCLKNINVLTI